MNLDSENHLISKSKINFPKIKRSLWINPYLLVQSTPPNTIWDPNSSGSSSSNGMNIIGEIPPIYANIDPSTFHNILEHPKIPKDEVEILDLDSIYIDQLGAMLQDLNMNIIEMK